MCACPPFFGAEPINATVRSLGNAITVPESNLMSFYESADKHGRFDGWCTKSYSVWVLTAANRTVRHRLKSITLDFPTLLHRHYGCSVAQRDTSYCSLRELCTRSRFTVRARCGGGRLRRATVVATPAPAGDPRRGACNGRTPQSASACGFRSD